MSSVESVLHSVACWEQTACQKGKETADGLAESISAVVRAVAPGVLPPKLLLAAAFSDRRVQLQVQWFAGEAPQTVVPAPQDLLQRVCSIPRAVLQGSPQAFEAGVDADAPGVVVVPISRALEWAVQAALSTVRPIHYMVSHKWIEGRVLLDLQAGTWSVEVSGTPVPNRMLECDSLGPDLRCVWAEEGRFNPDVAALEGAGAWMVARRANYRVDACSGFRFFASPGKFLSETWLREFDPQAPDAGRWVPLDVSRATRLAPEPSSLEDARLVPFDGRLWIAGNLHPKEGPPASRSLFCLGELDLKNRRLKSAVVLESPEGRPVEKNWMFFERDRELLIIYDLDPISIYRVDVSRGRLDLVSSFSVGVKGAWGGSKLLPVAGGFLGIVHSKEGRGSRKIYRNHFFWMSQDLRTYRVSDPFSLRQAPIEFGSGLWRDTENLLIGVGYNDAAAAVESIPIARALARLGPENREVSDSAVACEIPAIPLSGTIPKKVHFTYRSWEELAPELRANIEDMRRKNPDWEVVFYSHAAVQTFIYETYGEEMLLQFLRINPEYGASRADFFRYLCVYAQGGVYLDAKSSVVPPLDTVLPEDAAFILGQWQTGPGQKHAGFYVAKSLQRLKMTSEYQTWHVIARQGHPFLRAVIARVLHNIATYTPTVFGVGFTGTLELAGPVAYTHAILSVQDTADFTLLRGDVETAMGLKYTLFESIDVHQKLMKAVSKTGEKKHYTELTTPVVQPIEKAREELSEFLKTHSRHPPKVIP